MKETGGESDAGTRTLDHTNPDRGAAILAAVAAASCPAPLESATATSEPRLGSFSSGCTSDSPAHKFFYVLSPTSAKMFENLSPGWGNLGGIHPCAIHHRLFLGRDLQEPPSSPQGQYRLRTSHPAGRDRRAHSSPYAARGHQGAMRPLRCGIFVQSQGSHAGSSASPGAIQPASIVQNVIRTLGSPHQSSVGAPVVRPAGSAGCLTLS